MHCADWIKNTVSYPVGDMSSQRISEFLAIILPEEREHFYQTWCKRRLEVEYLALDITSVSSYSELVEDIEWGYNRDGEDLPQVNICLLVGEKSRSPVYQTVYAGSLKDVSTLRTTLRKFDSITGGKPVLVVMDKGFYSKKNVDDMLMKEGLESCQRFMVAVPFTSGFAKKQVEGERKDIDTIAKTIRVGGQTLRAVTKERVWNDKHKVYAHIYFSPDKAHGRREDIFGHVAMLRDEAEADPEKYANSCEHKKYLNIRKSEKTEGGYTVSVREGAVEAALGTQGWLVIISNDVSNAKEAIQIYRAKDVVEKGFLRLKCDLDIGRLRVHSQERVQNKVFVGFISLILLSQIHSVMAVHDMYEKMTMKQLLRTLARHRVQIISGKRIVYPVTKVQREIYEAFGVSLPM
jgi:transposase